MGVRISFKLLRRRLWRRRILPKPTILARDMMRKAGQHRLPGGQERLRPGVLGPGGVTDPRFESGVTLQVRMHILG